LVSIALIIIGAAVIRWRLAAMPLERDEGEYAYIAQQLLRGVPPYESAYSMKLPGIYVIYALFLACFGQTITAIHLGLIIFNAATIIVIFLLTRHMFGDLAAIAAGGFYAILSVLGSAYGMTANAEHFVLLPALIGILLIVKYSEGRRFWLILGAGLLFGLAFLIKQQGIFFAIFGGLYLLFSRIRRRPVECKKIIIEQLVFITGTIIPYVLVCVFYWRIGLFDKFWFWTVTYAHKYTLMMPLDSAWKFFKQESYYIVSDSILIWLLALAGLSGIIVRRDIRNRLAFIAGLLLFSFLAVCPGFYFRGHYFIFLFPAVSIVAGAGFAWFCKLFAGIRSEILRGILIAAAGLICVGVNLYQQRLYLFELGPVGVCRYLYRGHPFVESLNIAEYIRKNTSPDDTIAVLGSEPQIYFYSNRRSVTPYIYTFPITEPHEYAGRMKNEMLDDIESTRPKFIIMVSNPFSWFSRPGPLDEYNNFKRRFDSYRSKFYYITGIIDMRVDGPTVYRWDDDVAGYYPVSNFWITVFKRK